MDEFSQTFVTLHEETMAALRVQHPDWAEEVFTLYAAKFARLLRELLGRPNIPSLEIFP